jgi:hypothetical protein
MLKSYRGTKCPAINFATPTVESSLGLCEYVKSEQNESITIEEARDLRIFVITNLVSGTLQTM